MINKNMFSILFLVALDQITKYIIHSKLYVCQVTSFFNIVYVTNTGVAFGMFRGANIILVVFTFLVLIGFYFWHKKSKHNFSKLFNTAVVLIVSGAIGNLIDRIFRGYVIDFLDFHALNYHWPAFNVADSCICIGGAMICISLMLCKQDKQCSR